MSKVYLFSHAYTAVVLFSREILGIHFNSYSTRGGRIQFFILEKVTDLSWGLGTHKLVDVQDRCKSSIEQIRYSQVCYGNLRFKLR
jgi:hypothetical protein